MSPTTIYVIYSVDSDGFQGCFWPRIETNRTKGLAFVSFYERVDALRAMEKLDKKGYDNLIIRVELAGKRE